MFGNDHIRHFSDKTVLEPAIGRFLQNRCALKNDSKNSSRFQIFCTIQSLMYENGYLSVAVKIH